MARAAFSNRLMTQHERLVAETLSLCDELKTLMEEDTHARTFKRHRLLRQKIHEHRQQIRMHVDEWRKSRH